MAVNPDELIARKLQKESERIENNTIINPMRIKLGEIVSLDGKGFFKIMGFEQRGKDVYCKLAIFITADYRIPRAANLDNKREKLKDLKPAYFFIEQYEKQIEDMQKMLKMMYKCRDIYNFSNMFDKRANKTESNPGFELF